MVRPPDSSKSVRVAEIFAIELLRSAGPGRFVTGRLPWIILPWHSQGVCQEDAKGPFTQISAHSRTAGGNLHRVRRQTHTPRRAEFLPHTPS